MKARSVKLASRAALGLTALLVLSSLLQSSPTAGLLGDWDGAAHFIAFYALAAFGFVAFPKTRRGDIAQLVALSAIAVEGGRWMLHHDAQMPDLMADLAGVALIYASSHAEQLRRRSRESPHGPAWDRRRSDTRKRAKTSSRTYREYLLAEATLRKGVQPLSIAHHEKGEPV